MSCLPAAVAACRFGHVKHAETLRIFFHQGLLFLFDSVKRIYIMWDIMIGNFFLIILGLLVFLFWLMGRFGKILFFSFLVCFAFYLML